MKGLPYPLNKNVLKFIQLLLIGYWLIAYLPDSLGNYEIYLVCGILGAAGVLSDYDRAQLSKRDKWVIGLLSVLFSAIVMLAEYHLFTVAKTVIGTGVAGFLVAWNALSFLYVKLKDKSLGLNQQAKRPRPAIVFLISAVIIVVIDLVYLFTCEYPGSITADGIWQIWQIEIDSYTNHHPYWHTMIIKAFMDLGMALFGEINAAAAVFSVFQIVCMAMCFSFVVVTLYQMGVSYGWLAFVFAWYAFMPYHVTYSIMMSKDVLFGACILLFVISLFRVFYKVGKREWINYALLVFSSLGFGMLRNNGLLALLATTFCLFLFFRLKQKKIGIIFVVTVVVSYILTGPFLDKIGVEPTGIQESLSIPCQQIARVIVDGVEITPEQREKLEAIVDVEAVPSLYVPYVSDNIKFAIDRDYLSEHKMEYLMLWVELGLDHPWTYIKAWVDQTRGYWNGGYDYWISAYYIYDNEFGLYKTVNMPELRAVVYEKMIEFEYGRLWRVFRGIGSHVWLVGLLSVFNLLRGEGKKAFLSLPVLFVVATLLVATPVFSEFRYAYSVFTCAPFLTMMTFCKGEQK